MDRAEIFARIRRQAEGESAVRALGATALYIYGSQARGEARPGSDLNVFVDFDPERFTFVELVEPEDLLARELDLHSVREQGGRRQDRTSNTARLPNTTVPPHVV